MSSKPRNCSENIFPLAVLWLVLRKGNPKHMICSTPPKKVGCFPFVSLQKNIYKWNSWVFTQHGGFSGLRKGGFTQPTGRDDLTRPSTVEMRRRCRRRSEVANSRRSKKDASTALNTMTTSMGAYMVGGVVLTLGIGGLSIKKLIIVIVIVGNYWVFWSSKEVPSCVGHQNLGIFVNVESFAKRSESNNLCKFLL